MAKIPYMLVLGGREAEAGVVAVRSREKGDAHRVLALYGNPNDRYW